MRRLPLTVLALALLGAAVAAPLAVWAALASRERALGRVAGLTDDDRAAMGALNDDDAGWGR